MGDEPGYGCCAVGINAVCCLDKVSCCPENTTCDLENKMCKSKIPILTQKTNIILPPLKEVVCNDGKTRCPDKNTCCPLPTNGYGCCPSPEAVCCEDMVHCCPHGHTCKADSCDNSDGVSVPMLTKLPAVPHMDSANLCPDDMTECLKNETCCPVSDDKWGCCPTTDAVCCSNGSFCCPHKTTCDVENKTCIGEVPLTKIQHHFRMKIVSSSMFITVGSNVCPDDQSECKDNQSCCLLKTGKYGCCSGTNAVCCPDKEHCCLSGYTCEKNGQCIKKINDIL